MFIVLTSPTIELCQYFWCMICFLCNVKQQLHKEKVVYSSQFYMRKLGAVTALPLLRPHSNRPYSVLPLLAYRWYCSQTFFNLCLRFDLTLTYQSGMANHPGCILPSPYHSWDRLQHLLQPLMGKVDKMMDGKYLLTFHLSINFWRVAPIMQNILMIDS